MPFSLPEPAEVVGLDGKTLASLTQGRGFESSQQPLLLALASTMKKTIAAYNFATFICCVIRLLNLASKIGWSVSTQSNSTLVICTKGIVILTLRL